MGIDMAWGVRVLGKGVILLGGGERVMMRMMRVVGRNVRRGVWEMVMGRSVGGEEVRRRRGGGGGDV